MRKILFLLAGIVLSGASALASVSGTIDSTFHPTNINYAVRAVLVQSDAKIIIAGEFTSVAGVARSHIARLNSDGSLDTSFDPGVGPDAPILCLGLQSDGKILVGGNFQNYNGSPHKIYARLNSSGSLDTTFTSPTGYLISGAPVMLQPTSGGKVLMGINGVTSISPLFFRNTVVRLNSDGTVDTSYTAPNPFALTMAAVTQSDGKIITGGYGTGAHPTNMMRLLATGAVDTTFNGTGATNIISGILPLPSGKYFAWGGSTAVWLNSDGSPDTGASTTFDSYGYNILGGYAQSDGKVLLCGDFSTVNGATHIRIVRLNSNGTTDTSFDAGTGPSTSAYAVTEQADGKILVGGAFILFNNSYPSILTRLLNTVLGPPDTNAPTVTMTAPTIANTTSNTVTAQGTAHDNIGVTQVLIRVGSNDFAPATGTTNWTAVLNLLPGTNVIQVKSVDAAGNESAVASKTIFYTQMSPVALTVSPGGTVSITNGTPLAVGKSYTIVARPLAGFSFVNWLIFDPSVRLLPFVSNTNKSLTFTMHTGLSLLANFIDSQIPTIAITSPPAGVRTNALLTVTGTAKDNVGVDAVIYRVNHGAFETALGTTNWHLTIELTPGTNVVEVQSLDAVGNHSLLASRTFFYSTKSPLTLIAGTGGKIMNRNGTMLEVGRGYTIMAMPTNKNMIFLDWSIGSTQRTATLNFLMISNLTLQANFTQNPFPSIKGTYNGLFAEFDDTRYGHSGFLTFKVDANGVMTGKMLIAGDVYPFSQKFDGYKFAIFTLSKPGKPTYTVTLQLSTFPLIQPPSFIPVITDAVFGTVTTSNFTASLNGYRAWGDATTNTSPAMGRYTVAVVPAFDFVNPPPPVGYGVGTLVVDKAGNTILKGTLPDNTPISQTMGHGQAMNLPIYLPLKDGSQLYMSALLNVVPTGTFASGGKWHKLPNARNKYYPAGFTNNMNIFGASYTPPARGSNAVTWVNALYGLSGGNLPDYIHGSASATNNNAFVFSPNTNQIKLSLTPADGMLTGTFFHPAKRASTQIVGAYLKQYNAIYGFFLGTNQSGILNLQPPIPPPF